MQTGRFAALLLALGLALTACGGGNQDSEANVNENASFQAGTTMAKLNERGSITVGVKFDQPGIGFKNPATGKLEGFDIEVAKIIAGALGIEPDDIEYKETVSKNREPFLQQGTVDIVIASYSITPERRKKVGQTGPYYVTGQQLLVREADKKKITGPEDLEGVKVCSVTGSTSIKNVVEDYGADPAPFSTYTECVQQLLNKQVDAVTTDGAILLGYAAEQPKKLEVVGKEFSEERYGIGYKKGDTTFCKFLNKTLRKSFQDGSLDKAFASTLGKAGVQPPKHPKLDSCR